MSVTSTSASLVSLTMSRCFFMREELLGSGTHSYTWSRLHLTAGSHCWIMYCTILYVFKFACYFSVSLHLDEKTTGAIEKNWIFLLTVFLVAFLISFRFCSVRSVSTWNSKYVYLLGNNCRSCLLGVECEVSIYRAVLWVTVPFPDESMLLLS